MALTDFMAFMQGQGQNFNPYGAGQKRYGASGRDAPNIGPTATPEGYAERDLQTQVRRNAMLRRLQAMQGQNYMSSDYLNPANRSY